MCAELPRPTLQLWNTNVHTLIQPNNSPRAQTNRYKRVYNYLRMWHVTREANMPPIYSHDRHILTWRRHHKFDINQTFVGCMIYLTIRVWQCEAIGNACDCKDQTQFVFISTFLYVSSARRTPIDLSVLSKDPRRPVMHILCMVRNIKSRGFCI